jgi:hypothetical protein
MIVSKINLRLAPRSPKTIACGIIKAQAICPTVPNLYRDILGQDHIFTVFRMERDGFDNPISISTCILGFPGQLFNVPTLCRRAGLHVQKLTAGGLI